MARRSTARRNAAASSTASKRKRHPKAVPGWMRADASIDPRGQRPSSAYACDDPMLGERVTGRDYSGTVLGCMTPPAGEKGRRLLVGRVATRGAVKRAKGELARSRKTVGARRKRLDERAAFERDFRAGSPDPLRPRALPPPPPFGWGAGSPDPSRPRQRSQGTVWETARAGERVRWVPTKASVIAAGVGPVEGELLRRQRTKFWSAVIATPTGKAVVWANQGDLYLVDGFVGGAFVPPPPPPPVALQPIGPVLDTPPRREFRQAQPVNLVIPASSEQLLPRLPRYRDLGPTPEAAPRIQANLRETVHRRVAAMIDLGEQLPFLSPAGAQAIEDAKTILRADRGLPGYALDSDDFSAVYAAAVDPYELCLVIDAHYLNTQVARGYFSGSIGHSRNVLASLAVTQSTLDPSALGRMTGKTGDVVRDLSVDSIVTRLTPPELPQTPEDALNFWLVQIDAVASQRHFNDLMLRAMGLERHDEKADAHNVPIRDGYLKTGYESDAAWLVDPSAARANLVRRHLEYLDEMGSFALSVHRPKKGDRNKWTAIDKWYHGDRDRRLYPYAVANVLAQSITSQPAVEYYHRFILPATESIEALALEKEDYKRRYDAADFQVQKERIARFWTAFEKLAASEDRIRGNDFYNRSRAYLKDRSYFHHFMGVGETNGDGYNLSSIFTGNSGKPKADLPYIAELVKLVSSAWKGAREEIESRAGISKAQMTRWELLRPLPSAGSEGDSIAHRCWTYLLVREAFRELGDGSYLRTTDRHHAEAVSFAALGIRPEAFFPFDAERRGKDWDRLLRLGLPTAESRTDKRSRSNGKARLGKSPRSNGKRSARQVSGKRRTSRRR